MVIGILASAALASLYVYNVGGFGWLLGFVVWVPWLRALDSRRSLSGVALGGYLMSVAYTAAAFAWFGQAIGGYTHIGPNTGLAVLLLAAPLFQPQVVVFAMVRHAATRQYGAAWGAVAAASVWVAVEWLVPKTLGDTLGYGLYPSTLLRQNAAWGGAAGLTVALLLTNECFARAFACRRQGIHAVAKPLAWAFLFPVLLATYGLVVMQSPAVPGGKPLRMGLVQANIVDYERQRQEMGTHAVVRQILDTHFAMSYDAVERHKVDAVLWSETVYPTTFAQPKSSTGAELDQEILGIVNAAQVPFVFGTYDQDAAGEYNAAAFVSPGAGLIGMYRKSRLFPFTEQVPPWLDGPTLRRWLPWVGNWQPGSGARVLPLQLADGREIPVLPLICLDDVDTGLAIQGARLGAQAILTLSNDSWFTAHPQGARLHQAVAAFRSIETGLSQFRVTTNGYSAAIDATGAVKVASPLGERNLLIADLPVGVPTPTLLVRWGDWVGKAGAVLLLLLGLGSLWQRIPTPQALDATTDALGALDALAPSFNARVFVMPPLARLSVSFLRVLARGSLLGMGIAMLLNSDLQSNTLAQIRLFTSLFLAPELAAWCVLWAFSARAFVENGNLVLTRGANRMELALDRIAALEPWRVPLPGPGVAIKLATGGYWHYSLAIDNPNTLGAALAHAGDLTVKPPPEHISTRYLEAVLAVPRGRLGHPLLKFALLPTVLALGAFRLHQHIAYGSSFGEYYTFGLKAYAISFGLWWAAWLIGVVLCAAALRAAIEVGTLLAGVLWPAHTIRVRYALQNLGLAMLYIGMPAWLLLRAFGG